MLTVTFPIWLSNLVSFASVFGCIPILENMFVLTPIRPTKHLESALCGLAFSSASGSLIIGKGSSWGCFLSNSDIWTVDPFHYLTISLYGKAIPDRSDILLANLPDAYLAIMKFLVNKF